MVAFGMLRASFILFVLLTPVISTGNTTIHTPFGELPAGQVHEIPEGNARL